MRLFFPEKWADAEVDILAEMMGGQKRSFAMRREIAVDDDKIDCCIKVFQLMAERGNDLQKGQREHIPRRLTPIGISSQVMTCRYSCLRN